MYEILKEYAVIFNDNPRPIYLNEIKRLYKRVYNRTMTDYVSAFNELKTEWENARTDFNNKYLEDIEKAKQINGLE